MANYTWDYQINDKYFGTHNDRNQTLLVIINRAHLTAKANTIWIQLRRPGWQTIHACRSIIKSPIKFQPLFESLRTYWDGEISGETGFPIEHIKDVIFLENDDSNFIRMNKDTIEILNYNIW